MALRRVALRSGVSSLALLFGLSGGLEHAEASAFSAAYFGGEHGHVTTDNPTALYYNPAGIAFSSGTRLLLDGTLALRHATWRHELVATDGTEPAGAEGANSGRASLFNVFGGPMAGASTRFGPLALGLSVSVPFGGRAHWSKNSAFEDNATFPLAEDGIQRWHIIEGALTFIYFTAGAAYRFGPLAVGVSGNLIHSSAYSVQARDPTGDGTPDALREGRATLDTSGVQGSFGLGAMLEAIEQELWFGASYQAQPGLGPMELSGTLTTEYQGGSVELPVTLHQALPDIVRIGARYRPTSRWELRLFGGWTRWSVLQTQCASIEGYECAVDPSGADASAEASTVQNLRRRFRDTAGVRAGVSYWLSPSVEAFAGLGFETGAVPDETLDPGLFDASNLLAALGARVALAKTWFLSGSYTHLQFLDRDNTGSSELSNARPPTRRPDGGGHYTQWIGLINANLEVEL